MDCTYTPVYEHMPKQLPIGEGLLDVFPVKFLSLCGLLLSVLAGNLALVFETIDDELSLFFGQKARRLWEVVERPVGEDGDNHSHKSLEYEDPPPACRSSALKSKNADPHEFYLRIHQHHPSSQLQMPEDH